MKVSHVACPQCRKIGKDTKGDNLAVYPDGGKFCFACGYTERSSKYVPPVSEAEMPIFRAGEIPPKLQLYLEQYLTASEIRQHFTYDTLRQRIVLKDTLPEFYWGRDGHGGRTKVFTQGEVPFHVFGKESDTLVVVEDPISAIAVGRVYSSLPLFGAYLHPRWYSKLIFTGCTRLVFWLDNDKSKESLSLALSFRHLFETQYIITEKDPKCYVPEEVGLIVNTKLGIDKPTEEVV
jgi:hypothetical protein